MNFKSILAKPFAQLIHNKTKKNMLLAVEHQDAILNNLLRTGAQTQFGKDHYLKEVNDYQSFTQSVPLRDYEQLYRRD